MFSSPYGASSPMQTVSPVNRFGGSSEDTSNKPPSFLFGSNKRRSIALTSTHNPYLNSPSTGPDTFASPLPSHMKDGSGSSGKNVHWSPALVQEKTIMGVSLPSKSGTPFSPATKGPPLRSLREDLDTVPSKVARHSMPQAQDSPAKHTPTHSTTMNNSMHSQSMNVPTENYSDCWVTVFGFPASDASNVLKFFSRHGEIVQHQFPSRGNWVHIRYSTPIHAHQALTRNAHILDGCVRIGVVPCTEKELVGDVVNRSLLNHSVLATHQEEPNSSFIPAVTPRNDNFLDTSLNASRSTMASRTGMRSLASAYQAANADVSIHHKDHPSKDNGLMSKLWSYVGS